MALNFRRGTPEQDMFTSSDFKVDDSLLSQVMSASKQGLAAKPIESAPQMERTRNVESYLSNPKSNTPVSQVPIPESLPSGPIGQTIYDDGKYNSYTGLTGNKAYRNNNPGNISGMSGKLLYGATAFAKNKTGDVGDRSQLVFQTPEAGWRGMNRLMSGKSYNNAPIEQAFSKYQSNQDAWANMLTGMRAQGIQPSKSTFNQLSPQQRVWFMNQRANHEGFTGAPVTEQMLY